MKKLLILFLILTLGLALVACGGKDPCTEHTDADKDGKCDNCAAAVEPDDDGEKGDTGEDLVLVTDSVTGFAVVIADSLTDKAEGYVNDFVKNLNRYYLEDGNLKQNYDAPGFDDAVEIIFGSPNNRGDAFIKDEHYLGYKGFSVELIGNKLFVLGGSDKGYQEAIKYLEDTLFDLEGYGEDTIDELVIPKGTKYEYISTDYNITEFTIDGNEAKEYVITYTARSKIAKSAATILQNSIYKEAGIWLPYVSIDDLTDEQKVIYVEYTKGDKDRTTEEGFTLYVKGGDLHIECEFENKFEEAMNAFVDSKLSSSKVKIAANYTFKKDVRNIYYKDFGAKGDGETDDFFAIQACHEYANEYGHTVNGTKGHTYYIGAANGTESIPVKTDTYWNLCSFIFDDRDVPDPRQGKNYLASIFSILPDKESYTLTDSKLPVTNIPSGSVTIGDWKPGERVMVALYDNTKRHYIRYGVNMDNGKAQSELIIVNADGTIDPDTPVVWDYTTVSKMVVYPCDDAPITFSGGYKGQEDVNESGIFDNFNSFERATVYTYLNDAPSEYKYFARNFLITRSNVTIENIEHFVDEHTAETSAPYTGFIRLSYCTDITVEGMVFDKQKRFFTTGASGGSSNMGTYEIAAEYANRVTWKNCRQYNYFMEDGAVVGHGIMGTNYCKNLTFDNMVASSFDAHCNLYNATIKDTTCSNLLFIGSGTIVFDNVTVYTDGNSAALILRDDYGATWRGDIKFKDIVLKTSKDNPTLSLISAAYTNHDFGYACYLPERIDLDNAKIVKYGFKIQNGVRSEWEVATNHVSLHLFSKLEKYSYVDISDPNANMSKNPNDYSLCKCHEVYDGTKSFNDTDGDGRCNNDANPNDSYTVWCWGFETAPNKETNINPYAPPKEIYVTNCGDLKIILPDTPQFKDTEFYIDGVSQK